jgi:hypothetical protein
MYASKGRCKMPNCVQFFRKSDISRTPVVLNRLDEEICKHMNIPVHPTGWCCGWSVIQFEAALGKTLSDISAFYKAEVEECKENDWDSTLEENLLKIAQYLEENFTTDAWAER